MVCDRAWELCRLSLGPVGQRLTPAVAVLLHGPHGALVVAPGQLLPNHLQLPEAPVGEVGPAQLESGTRRLEGRARPWLIPARAPGGPHVKAQF